MPTLGQVAKEERFAPLRALLQQVDETPVDQLGADLRVLLLKRGGHDLELLLGSFFGACDAAADQRKRARSGGGGDEGEWFMFFLVFVALLTTMQGALRLGPRKSPTSTSRLRTAM